MKQEDISTLSTGLGSNKRHCPSGLPITDHRAMTQESDHKTKKYDRQLRLWGDHGQSALEKAKVCLIGATATGTEVLKNLVLPGLGFFCIVDGETVRGSDLGNNFFVTAQDVGRSRAEAATRLLLEMNGDVRGEYITDSLDNILKNRPNFFHHFTAVIVSDFHGQELLLELGKNLWPVGVPLVISCSYGLVGYIRLVFHEHLVTEAKPDNFNQDLHLEAPFPDLITLRDQFDFSTLTKKAHSHVPYVIILLACLDKWKSIHGPLPETYKEKVKFREFIEDERWKNEDGVPLNEENFEEACKAVVKTIGVKKIPDEILKLFADPACQKLTIFSPKFWILVHAIRDFTLSEGGGHLPVAGTLPDMFSDTDGFISLQNVYKKKADSDAEIVCGKVHKICRDLGLSDDFIPLSEVKYYCKHAAFLRCIRTSSLEDEFAADNSSIAASLTPYGHDDPQFRSSLWYIMLRAVREFWATTGLFPGASDSDLEKDSTAMQAIARRHMESYGLSEEFRGLVTDDVLQKYAKEISRFGGEQVHSVAAFIGGTVGQEVIKLITGQYVPLNNTLIYDAAACVTNSFQF